MGTTTKNDIKEFIKKFVARTLNMDSQEIDADLAVDASYGFESMDALSLGAELEDWLEIELDVNLFFEHRTINELTDAVMVQRAE